MQEKSNRVTPRLKKQWAQAATVERFTKNPVVIETAV